jgi:hypothetical protein
LVLINSEYKFLINVKNNKIFVLPYFIPFSGAVVNNEVCFLAIKLINRLIFEKIKVVSGAITEGGAVFLLLF